MRCSLISRCTLRVVINSHLTNLKRSSLIMAFQPLPKFMFRFLSDTVICGSAPIMHPRGRTLSGGCVRSFCVVLTDDMLYEVYLTAAIFHRTMRGWFCLVVLEATLRDSFPSFNFSSRRRYWHSGGLRIRHMQIIERAWNVDDFYDSALPSPNLHATSLLRLITKRGTWTIAF